MVKRGSKSRASSTNGGKLRTAEFSAPPTKITDGPWPTRSNAIAVPSSDCTVTKFAFRVPWRPSFAPLGSERRPLGQAELIGDTGSVDVRSGTDVGGEVLAGEGGGGRDQVGRRALEDDSAAV